MKKLLLALALLFAPASAFAQCSGVFPASTLCGSVSGGVPGQIPFSSITVAIPYTPPYSGGVTETQVNYNAQRVSIVDFGAIGDGNVANATVNTNALNNALATGKCVLIPYTAAGYNFGTNGINISNGQCIIGENYVTLQSQALSFFFHIVGSGFGASGGKEKAISNVIIDMNGSSVGSTAIRLGLATDNVANVRITNVKCYNAYECVGDEAPTGNNTSTFVIVKNLYATYAKGRQIYLRRSQGFIQFEDTTIDFTLNVATPTYGGAQIDDFGGVYLTRFNILGYGSGTPTVNTGVIGLSMTGNSTDAFGGNAAVYLDNVFVDTTVGDGIQLNNISYLFGNVVEANLNFNNAISLFNIHSGNLTNVVGNGSVGLSGTLGANAQGLTVNNSTGLSIANVWTGQNTGYGLSINGTSNGINVVNAIASGNTIGDFFFGNTAANNTINGGSASSVTNVSSGAGNQILNVTGVNTSPVAGSVFISGANPYTPGWSAAMTNGQILVGQSASSPLPKTISGDGTLSNAGALTITKTSGASFTAGATNTAAQEQARLAQGILVSNVTGVNFNSANTDTAIPISLPTGFTRFAVFRLSIDHASGTLTTSTVGVFSTTSGGGVGIITTQANTITTASDATVNNYMTLNGNAISMIAASLPTPNTIYFRVSVAQGTAATGDVSIFYQPLP